MNRYEAILNEVTELLNSGQKLPAYRMSIASVKDFTPGEIKQIRLNAKMTQGLFAACIGVSKKSVEAWEGGRSKPDGAARRTLGLMQNNPRFADEAGIIVR